MANQWGSDVPISQPVPPDNDVLVEMGGFGFSAMGLVHNLTDVDAEETYAPTYTPDGNDV